MTDETPPDRALTPAKRRGKTALIVVGGDGSRHPSPRRYNLTNLVAVRREMAAVYRLGREGRMSLPDCCRCVFILSNIGRVIVDSDLELRLAQLEKAVNHEN